MTAEYIYKCAKAVREVFKTDDPAKIFRMRGVEVKSSATPALCGMICIIDGKIAVFDGIGENSEGHSAMLAKLLGHAVLHRERLLCGESFEHVIFGSGECSCEREAELFASEFLISDEKVSELRNLGLSNGQIVTSFGEMRSLAVLKIFSQRCRNDSEISGTLCKSDVSLFSKYEV